MCSDDQTLQLLFQRMMGLTAGAAASASTSSAASAAAAAIAAFSKAGSAPTGEELSAEQVQKARTEVRLSSPHGSLGSKEQQHQLCAVLQTCWGCCWAMQCAGSGSCFSGLVCCWLLYWRVVHSLSAVSHSNLDAAAMLCYVQAYDKLSSCAGDVVRHILAHSGVTRCAQGLGSQENWLAVGAACCR